LFYSTTIDKYLEIVEGGQTRPLGLTIRSHRRPQVTHPRIITDPPSGVTGPMNLPIFSLAKTNGKMLPENINVPAAMAMLGKANLPLAVPNLGCREMAKRETPLKIRY
jgi:hypothetical protein